MTSHSQSHHTMETMLFSRHYPGLDFARSVAITMVMAAHFNTFIAFSLPDKSQELLKWSAHGVILFFALSGFLIGGKIIEELSCNRFSFKVFFIKRVLRIFPPYYFSLLLLLIIFFVGGSEFFSHAVGLRIDTDVALRSFFVHLLYFQNYSSVGMMLQQGIYWSLAIEEQFYILAPLILVFLYRFKRRLLAGGIGILILTAISIRFYLYYKSELNMDLNEWAFSVFRPLHSRFDALLYGILAAYIFINYRKVLSRSYLWKLLLLVVTLGTLGLSLSYGTYGPGYFNTCWQFTLMGVGFSTLVLFLCVSNIGNYIRPKRIFSHIASVSYGMYLYHLLMITPTLMIANSYFPFNPESHLIFFALFGVYYIMVVLVATVFYRLIDSPFMNLRKKFLLARRP